jgi:hypothetical protein
MRRGYRVTLWALCAGFAGVGMSPPADAQTVPAPAPTVPAIVPTASETVEVGRIVRVTLGGAPDARQRSYSLRLASQQSVIVDLIPLDPGLVRTRTFSRPIPGTSTALTLAPATLEVADAAGTVLRRKSSMDVRSITARSNAIERSIGDSGARVGFYPTAAGIYRITAMYDSPAPLGFELLVRERNVTAPLSIVPIKFGFDRELSLTEGVKSLFEFQTTQPNQLVILTMESQIASSSVELRAEGGEEAALIKSDEKTEEESQARIVSALETPGRYTIVAAGGTGAHRLKLRTYDPPRLSPTPLRVGETAGSFSGRDHGVLLGSQMIGYHLYSLDGEQGQTVSISMTSTDPQIDPILQAAAPSIATDATTSAQDEFSVIAANDDEEGQGLNARILVHFQQKGRIFVRAGAAKSIEPRGNYTIKIAEVPPPPRQTVPSR